MRKRAGTGNKEQRAVNKVARLEEKLDSLASLIRASPQTSAHVYDGNSAGSAQLAPLTPSSSSNATSTIQDPPRVHTSQTRGRTLYRDGELPCPKGLSELDQATLPNFDSSKIAPEDADEGLLIFRSHMLSHYPIICIPGGVNAHGLRAQSPFLWLCIMAVTMKSSLKQRALGLEIRRQIAYRIIIEGERNIDLLQGLLVYAGW